MKITPAILYWIKIFIKLYLIRALVLRLTSQAGELLMFVDPKNQYGTNSASVNFFWQDCAVTSAFILLKLGQVFKQKFYICSNKFSAISGYCGGNAIGPHFLDF
ncbi:MAG: hypothetical protein ACI9O0_001215 [Paracoccaceae bacterium]